MKIVCVGRNYVNHAKELGNEVPDEAVLFLKPSCSLNTSDTFQLPTFSQEVHFELELVLKVSQDGKDIAYEEAANYFDEIALGIDFTARDLQSKLKKKGLPWEKAKAFDGAAYLSTFQPISSLKNSNEILFELHQNGTPKQQGNSKDMLFDFNEIIVQASTYFTLKEGDLIYTGTPAGVGAVQAGDELVGYLEEEELFNLRVE